VRDPTPEGSYESQQGELHAASHAEYASADSLSPVRDASALRWRDLAYLGLFYLVAGAALTKAALMAASAALRIDESALQDVPATYVAVVAASQALLSLAVLAFLWLLVRSRGTASFWPALGWHGLAVTPRAALIRLGARYVLGGAALAIVIQAASYYAGTKSSVPMESFFRDRPSVLMMMALGILVAPLFEETLFRGCIYPVVAGTFGMPAGILVTGMLFGLAHSLQLAGAWKQVLLVTIVGIVLTYIRARTGTVLASYLVHLGYNSFLFGAFYIATRGLRYFPGS
jgi:membrane protease YdiL (CAAX protease family)